MCRVVSHTIFRRRYVSCWADVAFGGVAGFVLARWYGNKQPIEILDAFVRFRLQVPNLTSLTQQLRFVITGNGGTRDTVVFESRSVCKGEFGGEVLGAVM